MLSKIGKALNNTGGRPMNKVKFAIIGAGSVCFSPKTVSDILLSKRFSELDVEIYLMDIAEEALEVSSAYCKEAAKMLGRTVTMNHSTDLRAAVDGADYVVTAIELDRYHYWSMDFHLPRRYGFRQVYGENGGPGGMFHTLRNLPPMLEIAKTMEELCPDAWILNYTNPEAKLVEGVSKLTKINAVGLCHGVTMGQEQIALFTGIPMDEIDFKCVGLNHFGWITSIKEKKTGRDLYPLLKERERTASMLSQWDEYTLSRFCLRTYGLWSYPGANHIGEYLAWADQFLASSLIQYFYDPVKDDIWNGGQTPEFIYSFSEKPTDRPLFSPKKHVAGDPAYQEGFTIGNEGPYASQEFGIRIAEALTFNVPYHAPGVNVLNKGYARDLMQDMAIELPADVDGAGLHPVQTDPLPVAVAAMINIQGAIHQLVLDAYVEKSRNKLLQAILLDPTISTYNNAVALINDICELQKDILPEMHW